MPPNQTPNTQPNPNQLPVPPVGPEQLKPAGFERSPMPVAPEVAPAAPVNQPGASAPSPLPVVPPSVASPASSPIAAPATPTIGPSPATAGDVDVIEKEWVDQADKIIEQTKGDPYVEEEAEEALQQDYLKKRYGHDVKKPDAQ
jgi:hypothetical protein